MLVGVLPFLMTVAHLVMAFTSVDRMLDHHVHGAEFSVLDGLALALYFSMPGPRYPIPFRIAMVLYFVAAALSTLQSAYPLASLFYVWQLARMFLVYAVVAKGSADPRVPLAILKGMAIGICVQAVFAVWERFGLGVHQATGTFQHQNFLGLVSHFVIFPFFAMFLAGRGGRMAFIVLLAGLVVELLTASRATIGLAGVAYVLVLGLSGLRQWTSRKSLVLVAGLVLLATLIPIALSNVEGRGEAELESSNEERSALTTAAINMLMQHPLGVGANNYVMAANIEGYNPSAGVSWTSDSAFVHDSYLLVGAESGYLGLFTFVILLLRPLFVAFNCGLRHRRDPRGDLLIGLGVALFTVYIHAFFEWIFIIDLAQYMLAITFGMVAGLSAQLGYWRPLQKRGAGQRVTMQVAGSSAGLSTARSGI
jgi:O-antigen ligase